MNVQISCSNFTAKQARSPKHLGYEPAPGQSSLVSAFRAWAFLVLLIQGFSTLSLAMAFSRRVAVRQWCVGGRTSGAEGQVSQAPRAL